MRNVKMKADRKRTVKKIRKGRVRVAIPIDTAKVQTLRLRDLDVPTAILPHVDAMLRDHSAINSAITKTNRVRNTVIVRVVYRLQDKQAISTVRKIRAMIQDYELANGFADLNNAAPASSVQQALDELNKQCHPHYHFNLVWGME